MTRVRFERTTQMFKRAKTFYALDRAATMIGLLYIPMQVTFIQKKIFHRLTTLIFIMFSI
jgi:hypothetical protein